MATTFATLACCLLAFSSALTTALPPSDSGRSSLDLLTRQQNGTAIPTGFTADATLTGGATSSTEASTTATIAKVDGTNSIQVDQSATTPSTTEGSSSLFTAPTTTTISTTQGSSSLSTAPTTISTTEGSSSLPTAPTTTPTPSTTEGSSSLSTAPTTTPTPSTTKGSSSLSTAPTTTTTTEEATTLSKPTTTATSTTGGATSQSQNGTTEAFRLSSSDQSITIVFSVILGVVVVSLSVCMLYKCHRRRQYAHRRLNESADMSTFVSDDDTLVISGGLYDAHPIYDNVPTPSDDQYEYRLEFYR